MEVFNTSIASKLITQKMSCLFRYQWENEFQWKARQIFINTHKDEFDEIRLASLSNAWSNWRFHGCLYCNAVQSILAELDEKLPNELHMAIKEIPAHRHLNEVMFQKSSDMPPDGRRLQSNEIVPGLKLYLPYDDAISNPITVLMESAQKSKKEIEFQELGLKSADSQFLYEVAVIVGMKVIATGMAATKKESKRNCALRAIEILKSSQPIHIKNPPNHDSLKSIEKGDLVKSAFQNANKIDQTNVGNIMLRKMGWTGEGGLATHGISEPIFIASSDGRKGLGHSDESVTIDKFSIEDKLTQFLRHSLENEIKFSNKLSKEERALVHKLCTKYGLKHKSFGKGDDRYLVVSKH